MKKLLLLAFIPLIAGATQSFKITPSGSSLVPTTFTSSNGYLSIIYDESAGNGGYVPGGSSILRVMGPSTLCVFNDTSSRIAVSTGASIVTAPDNFPTNILVPASSGRCADMMTSGVLYVRSDTGTSISSGTIMGDVNPLGQ